MIHITRENGEIVQVSKVDEIELPPDATLHFGCGCSCSFVSMSVEIVLSPNEIIPAIEQEHLNSLINERRS